MYRVLEREYSYPGLSMMSPRALVHCVINPPPPLPSTYCLETMIGTTFLLFRLPALSVSPHSSICGLQTCRNNNGCPVPLFGLSLGQQLALACALHPPYSTRYSPSHHVPPPLKTQTPSLLHDTLDLYYSLPIPTGKRSTQSD